MLTLIVPFFNAEKTLKRCLDSIVHQDYRDLEVLLVNDGSTDKSKIICNTYVKKYGFKMIEQKNAGVPTARNTGIKNCSGDWISFVDADDWIENNYCSKLMDIALERQADIVCVNYCKDYRREEIKANSVIPINSIRKISYEEYITDIFLLNKIPLVTVHTMIWGKVIKKALISENKIKFEKDLWLGDDLLFNLDMIKCRPAVFFLNRCLYHYTFTDNSLSNSIHNVDRDLIELSLILWKHIQERDMVDINFIRNYMWESGALEAGIYNFCVRNSFSKKALIAQMWKQPVCSLLEQMSEYNIKKVVRRNKIITTLILKKRFGILCFYYRLRDFGWRVRKRIYGSR